MPKPCRKPPVHPRLAWSPEAVRRGGGGPGRGLGPQAQGQAGGSDRVGEEVGQADLQGLEDLTPD
ncbi:MAG TPA: hypothetical protein VMY43_12405 [Methanothrix sp.]|nr:hypothetical protein [Methanothrix sp.]